MLGAAANGEAPLHRLAAVPLPCKQGRFTHGKPIVRMGAAALGGGTPPPPCGGPPPLQAGEVKNGQAGMLQPARVVISYFLLLTFFP